VTFENPSPPAPAESPFAALGALKLRNQGDR
jgi:hypothetical protein